MLCSSERRRRFSALQTAGRAAATARGALLARSRYSVSVRGRHMPAHRLMRSSPSARGRSRRQSSRAGAVRVNGRGTRWSDEAPLRLAAHAPEQNAEAEARQAQGPDDDMPQPRLGRAHDRRRWAIRDDRINSDARVQHQNGAPAGRTEVTASRPGGAFASSVRSAAAGRCRAASKPRRPAPHRAWPTPSSGSTSARPSCCTWLKRRVRARGSDAVGRTRAKGASTGWPLPSPP